MVISKIIQVVEEKCHQLAPELPQSTVNHVYLLSYKTVKITIGVFKIWWSAESIWCGAGSNCRI